MTSNLRFIPPHKPIPLLFALLATALLSSQSVIASDDRIRHIGAIVTASDDGSVPAWSGGLPIEHKSASEHHRNPFADEKPLFTITQSNYRQYQERLSPGLIALLEAYPDTFAIPVYPSHRTTRYPDWYYENSKHADQSFLSENGSVLENAVAGVNFPAPKNGVEVIWNHLTRWRGRYTVLNYSDAIVYADGERKLIRGKREVGYEIHRQADQIQAERQVLLYYLSYITAPAKLAGGALLAIDFLNHKLNPRKAWSYDAGQRRVKRLPYITYDSPAIMAESLRTADDTDLFNGSPDRFQWNLLGRRIMYVPYNNYALTSPELSYDEILTPKHINPEHTRFEAHRVWEVEGILKTSEYHIYSKRRFLVDEDSWSILVSDQYDHEGKIWRIGLGFAKHYYEVPVTFSAVDVIHDLKSRDYHAGSLTNEERISMEFFDEIPSPSYFTPAGLRAKLKQ